MRDNLAPGGLINPSYNKMKEKRNKAYNERMRDMSLENKYINKWHKINIMHRNSHRSHVQKTSAET
jgi:hypothetical protein